jgi:hypothetical protein
VRKRVVRHGTVNEYNNYGCRCDRCRDAWAAYSPRARSLDRHRARNLAAGLTANGTPRTGPYRRDSLALMARFGLQPDPRFLPQGRTKAGGG